MNFTDPHLIYSRLFRLTHLEVQVDISAIALHGTDHQISLEITGVESRQRETVSIPSLKQSQTVTTN